MTPPPSPHERLSAARAFAGHTRERWAIQQVYAAAPSYNFSHSVLESYPHLAVSRLPPVTWSDVGTPARLLKLLGVMRLRPAWMASRSAAFGSRVVGVDRQPAAEAR